MPPGEESMAERAYQSLRRRLILLDIAPGEAISESALSHELGVGRTPFREALKRLESDHLVVSYARRGTFATHVDITDLAAISEMRGVLEPLAARNAARHRREPVLTRLREVAHELESTDLGNDQRALLERDLGIHRLIYSAVDNHHLAETLIRLDDLATRIWSVVLDRIPNIAANVHEHAELLHAIIDGDADRAAALAASHVQHFEATVRKALAGARLG
ncbi:GntR family transcriptional regulator [Micrococcales bacterium 31B]|nr:GntR family transcriptional regulator [Micrococcales bacterium 31B]